MTKGTPKTQRQAKRQPRGGAKAARRGQDARGGADAAPAQGEAARQAAHERHVMEVWESCRATKDYKPYLDMAEAIRASRPDEPASTSAAKAEPATPAKPAIVHQPSEDSAQSPFARGVDQARAYYGKGGPGEVLVQAGFMIGPFGTIVPAKSLPEAKTARARLMEEVRAMAEFVIKSYRPGPEGQVGPLAYILYKLRDAYLADWHRALNGEQPEVFHVDLATIPTFSVPGFVGKWEQRILEAWQKGADPAKDAVLMRELLADALVVVDVKRPESFGWIKGLRKDNGAQLLALGDFLVERCQEDPAAETLKKDLHIEYLNWLKAAKLAHPERYGARKPLSFNAFAREINLSLATTEARPHLKWTEERKETWKGIRILPPNDDPAGDKAIRWTAEVVARLRLSLTVPTDKP